MASATGPSTTAVAVCSSAINFTGSDTPAAAGDNPRHVVTGDLDGNADADAVSNLLGNGDGTFEDSVAYSTSVLPVSVNAADLTSDGTQDLVVASSADDRIDVFTGSCD
ncbi:VCBS repeat-containing protein [Streptomyces sp. NBC_00124]|uniref:FG-GAP repeat domain-containing protein n=1 Tax=Streptomyces sp. NBC_00124 TaxID=2975662 RepID=UPI00225A09A9|nr:VCBS repeat-containing protein [Streptomyces sp. NBC_00124]MCX5365448.1 VCBS repeat-containing protein [Streptomyces sp. NBC_00124]